MDGARVSIFFLLRIQIKKKKIRVEAGGWEGGATGSELFLFTKNPNLKKNVFFFFFFFVFFFFGGGGGGGERGGG